MITMMKLCKTGMSDILEKLIVVSCIEDCSNPPADMISLYKL